MSGEPVRCPTCGAPISAVGAVCPACLFRAGAADETIAASDLTISAVPEHATRLSTPGTATGGSSRSVGSGGSMESGPTGLPIAIGPYRIVSLLGEGGMGVVYLAEQTEPIRRTVALKVIKLGMDTRDVVARFESERQALALMDHPNIARVIDAGATPDGRPYLVMEHVAGVPITDYSDAHRLSTRARLALVAQVCGAVQHAHQKGVIHRDLKPSNVLVGEQDGTPVPKIIDFGIAKATDQRLTERTMFTEQGQFIGTPEYMSPEQTLGVLDIDATTDIYALGVILYELLAGSLPFEATALRRAGYAEMQRIIREDEPPKPSTKVGTHGAAASDMAGRRQTDAGSLRKLLSGDLDWITLKALEKDRARRYASASEFAADITRYLNDEAVLASPPSFNYRALKFVRRHRLAVAAASLVFLSVVAGLVVSLIQYYAADAARQQAAYQAYLANISAAYSELKGAETGFRFIGTSSPAEGARRRLYRLDERLRNWEWRYLFEKTNSSRRTLWERTHVSSIAESGPIHWPLSTSGPGATMFIGPEDLPFSVSPDSGRLWWNSGSRGGRTRSISTWDLMGASSAETMLVPANQKLLALDPTGRLMATTSADDARIVSIVDRASGKEISRLADQASPANEARFNDRADTLVTVATDNTLRVWTVATGARRAEVRQPGRSVSCLRVSADGTQVIFNADGPHAWHVRRGGSARELSFESGGLFNSCAEFSPDGLSLAAGGFGAVRLWDLVKNTTKQPLLQTAGLVKSVAFNHEGSLIAAGEAGGIVQVWDLRTWDESTSDPIPMATLFGHDDSAVGSLMFSADGRRLFSGAESREVLAWDVPRIRLAAGFTTDERSSFTISGNGDVAATRGAKGVIEIWDVSRLEITRRLDAPGHGLTSMVLSGDGTRLAAGTDRGDVLVWRDLQSTPVLFPLDADKPGKKDAIERLAFSGTGTRLTALNANDVLRVWEVETGRVALKVTSALNRVAFDAAGQRVMTTGQSKYGPSTRQSSTAIEVWDLSTGAQALRLERGCPDAAAFSPDGTRIVMMGSCGPTFQLVEAKTGRIVTESESLRFRGASVAFSPDGTRLVTSNEQDGSVLLFDSATLEQVAAFREAKGQFGATRFSSDGTRILSAGDNGISILDSRSSYDPDALQIVTRLFAEEGLAGQIGAATDVLARLAVERKLPETVRDRAIADVEARGDRDADALYIGSWETVRRAGDSPSRYARALRMANACLRIQPKNPDYLALKGVAQYRVEQRQDALDTFQEASKSKNAPAALIAAFRSMALRELGRADEATVELERLREFMKKADHAKEPALVAILAETEALVARGGAKRD